MYSFLTVGRPSIPNPTLIVPSHSPLHIYDYTTMSNSPPHLYKSQQMYWGSPYTAESGDDSQADITASAISEASCSEADAAATAAAILMVQQYTVGLHPSPHRRVEEVGEEPRVEEGLPLPLLPPQLQSSWCSNITSGFIHRPVDAWKRWARNREWRRASSVPRWGWLNIM